jgi:hypothetical protein
MRGARGSVVGWGTMLQARSRYFSVQVAPQLSSRGWVDPVPDPLLLRKSGSAGNRTRDLWICSQELWPLDHRGGQSRTFFTWKYELFIAWSVRPESYVRIGRISTGKLRTWNTITTIHLSDYEAREKLPSFKYNVSLIGRYPICYGYFRRIQMHWEPLQCEEHFRN